MVASTTFAWGLIARAMSQGVIVVPQPRPHEPDVLSVCACDFSDNFWLHLLSGLSERAPRGFQAHAYDPKLHKWLGQVQCDPFPLESVDQAIYRAVGGVYWDDYRFGKRYHYLDPWIREEDYMNPRIGLATRAACLPGRMLLHLVCAHQALLPAVQGKQPFWDKFAASLSAVKDMMPTAAGRGTHRDLGSLEDSDREQGCAAAWPWAPIFGGRQLLRLKEYLDKMLSGSIVPDPQYVAYGEPFALTPEHHARINPYLQPCVPLVRECWSWGLRTALPEREQCEHCCNPAGADHSCFDATYTFQRCCKPLR